MRIISSEPARCNLHGTNLVSEFPAGCPFKADNPLIALKALCDRGYELLGSGDEELTDALDLLDRHDICKECVYTRLTHPRILRLRRRRTAVSGGWSVSNNGRMRPIGRSAFRTRTEQPAEAIPSCRD